MGTILARVIGLTLPLAKYDENISDLVACDLALDQEVKSITDIYRMKHLLTFLAFFLPGLISAQGLEIRKAQVVNYSMDNGWLNSMTVDMEIDSKGYVYFSNQRFEMFDGQKVERIEIPSLRGREFVEIERVDSLHFLVCADECFLFNTETQEFKLLLSTPGLWYDMYTSSDGTLKIIEERKGEYTFDKKTKDLVRFDTLDYTLFDSKSFTPEDQILHWNKLSYDPQDTTVKFFNSDYIKVGTAKLFSPKKNQETSDSLFLILSDRLELFNNQGKRITSIPMPKGTSLFTLSDIIQFSDHEFLVNLVEGLFVFDSRKMKFTYEIRNSQNEPIILNEYFRRVIKDGFNLHLLTHFSGYYRLNFLEYQLDNLVIPEGSKSIKAVLADTASNKILLANQLGEFYQFDLEGNLIGRIDEISQTFTASGIVKTDISRFTLCHSKACYQVEFAEDDSYQVSEVLTGDLGRYYSNKYLYQDTLNIYTQSNRIQIPQANPTDIQVKQVPHRAYEILIRGKSISWAETGSVIYVSGDNTSDTIPIATHLGGPICQIMLNDSTLLIGSRKGLYELNLRTYAILDYHEIDDWVYSIEKYRDYFFCSTNRGIIIVKDKSIIKRLTKADGLCSNEFNTNVSCKDGTGKLYFGGALGLVSFYPQEVIDAGAIQQRSPRSFRIDETREAKLENGRIVLEAGETSISFRISTIGPNPSADYNGQYLIPQITDLWIDAGKNSTINLTLAPGEYEVFYHTSNFFDPNALPNESFVIAVKEFWYKTKWFYGLVIFLLNLLLLGAIASYYRFKTVLQLRSVAAKEKLNSEKMRISRDLHDSLGTQMAMVGRNIDWLAANIEHLPAQELKGNLDTMLEVANNTNQSLRDSIWAFKQSTFNAEELSNRIRHIVDRYRKLNHEVKFEFESTLTANHSLSPSISLNLIRIIQEGLANATKHATCQTIKLQFTTNKQGLSIKLKDDGKGFQLESIAKGQGLDNIQDRAKEIGARVEISSINEIGTLLSLELKTHENT